MRGQQSRGGCGRGRQAERAPSDCTYPAWKRTPLLRAAFRINLPFCLLIWGERCVMNASPPCSWTISLTFLTSPCFRLQNHLLPTITRRAVSESARVYQKLNKEVAFVWCWPVDRMVMFIHSFLFFVCVRLFLPVVRTFSLSCVTSSFFTTAWFSINNDFVQNTSPKKNWHSSSLFPAVWLSNARRCCQLVF